MSEVWKSQSPEVIKHWIFEALYYHGVELNDWERKFLVDIDKYFHRNGVLTQRQQEILERIYAEKTK